MSFGYAHVIEEEEKFNKINHHEIMATILDISKLSVTKPSLYKILFFVI